MARMKTTQEISSLIKKLYEVAVEQEVSLPIEEESMKMRVFTNRIECDYYSCKLMLEELLKTRDNSKTLLRSVA